MDGKLLPLILNSRQTFDGLAGKILRCSKTPNIVVTLASKGDRSVDQMAALRKWQPCQTDQAKYHCCLFQGQGDALQSSMGWSCGHEFSC
jgi:hypothetical protein